MSRNLSRFGFLCALALVAACDKGDALVVVSLDANPALANLSRFAVTATVGSTTRTFDVTPTAAISIPPSFDFGVRVPPSLGDSLALSINAYAGATLRGSTSGTASVRAGKRTSLTLVFGNAPLDGGVDLIGLIGRDLTPPEGSDLLPVDLEPPPGSDLTVEPDLSPTCDESTCAPCTDCGSGGTCSKLVLSQDDDIGQTCQGSNTCSPTGACKIRQGFACNEASPEECATGNCVDGVCCNMNAAMCGECKICNKAGSEGTCTAATDGTDPSSECGAYNCRAGQCAGNCVCPTDPSGSTPCNNSEDGYTGGTQATLDCKGGYYCAGTGYTCIAKVCSGSCGYNIQCGDNSCPYPSLMCSC